MPGVGGGAAGLGALDFLRNNPQVLTSYFSIDISLPLVTFFVEAKYLNRNSLQ